MPRKFFTKRLTLLILFIFLFSLVPPSLFAATAGQPSSIDIKAYNAVFDMKKFVFVEGDEITDPSILTVDDWFFVKVEVSNISNFVTADFKLKYPTDKLTVQTGFPQANTVMSISAADTLDSTTGTYTFGRAFPSPQDFSNNKVSLVTILFKVENLGQWDITFDQLSSELEGTNNKDYVRLVDGDVAYFDLNNVPINNLRNYTPVNNDSTAPDAVDITVTNNSAGTNDTIEVSGLAAGDIVKVYDEATEGTKLGEATVAEGETSAMVSVDQIGTTAGSVYVTVTNVGKEESTRVEKAYNVEPVLPSTAPAAADITVTNNADGTNDTIDVSGLAAGDIVKVYDAATAGTKLGEVTVAVVEESATVSVDQLGATAGSVYVTVTSVGKEESTRIEKAYDAEPVLVSTAPDAADITVTNNSAGTVDTIEVIGLAVGDIVKVYDAVTAGAMFGEATVATGEETATVSVDQLGTNAGKVYVTVTSVGKEESTRIEKAYDAEPVLVSTAPDAADITVINNAAGTVDTIEVIGLEAGDIVKVYDSATAGAMFGEATVATGEETATISVDQLGTNAGKVYVTVTSVGKEESTRIEKAYDAEPVLVSTAPDAADITVTNNSAGTVDTIEVIGLAVGDIVKVYDAVTAGAMFGEATVATGEETATISVDQLGTNAGKVYVTVTSVGKEESTRIEKAYDAEPVLVSTAPDAADITVTNNSAGTVDTIEVIGLAVGDIVKVYNAATEGAKLGEATVTAGKTSATVSVQQLGTTAGKVYVTVTSVGKEESIRVEKAYDAESVLQSTAPNAANITVLNNLTGTADTIEVSGLTAGDIVNVYDSATAGAMFGEVAVATGEKTATVSVDQLGVTAGSVYVTVTSVGKEESTRVVKAYDAEPVLPSTAPSAANITVANNLTGTADTIEVSGLTAGDIVKVYNAATNGTKLGEATVAAGKTSATVSVQQLGTTAGKVYVTVTSVGKEESTRVEKAYSAESVTATPTLSGTVHEGDLEITGTAEPNSTVTIKRGTELVGTAQANSEGAFTVTIGEGITLAEDDELTITAKSAGKLVSTALTVTVETVDECFIATAAFGTKFQPSVVLLRDFRDGYLLTNPLGSSFVDFYYRSSPPIANFIADNSVLKFVTRVLLTPIVAVVYLVFHPVLLLLIVPLIILAVRRIRPRKSMARI